MEVTHTRGDPYGIRVIKKCRDGGGEMSMRAYRACILIITFIAYASFHASRKPISIVKSSLKGTWEPFTGRLAGARLGEIDVSFLLVYSLGMYIAGHLGDRLDLRVFLTAGMVGSGVFVGMFGMGYWLGIHSFGYYMGVQMVQGAFQATGWPSVVAVVGNWFGKSSRRGLIMGSWNAHTSVGNIAGSLISASLLRHGWGWSFLVPAMLVAMAGGLVYMFLVVCPEDAGFLPLDVQNVIGEEHRFAKLEPERPFVIELSKLDSHTRDEALNHDEESSEMATIDLENGNEVGTIESGNAVEEQSLLHSDKGELNQGDANVAIGFLDAWMIPGVAAYACCLFFSKLVAYTFLYWLPFYLKNTEISGKHLSDASAGKLSTLFDVGGVVGGILAGYISDRYQAQAVTSVAFLYLAIPTLMLFRTYGGVSMYVNIPLLMASGLFVNGPYSLITTAVSADLGTHSSINGNSRALATVIAIIDGTGSVGAALGPFLTGLISDNGWNGVFLMLIGAILLAGFFLMGLAWTEIAQKYKISKDIASDTSI